ncbi:methyltransferase FkbM family [Haloterrigena turkmenica DSM 5511]|uniref:Methyltransferase FkbM family n=1 Tax=Haloterrigena turkmenica (strain ATCC 51198 / DSM 5511 / JCM 9101 / NCIMB 13204 / VKM B-1734 / 4k) TaxID=543526 RepID=D2RQL4_HALTV|nr:FkbM family methyltransferase [Haloterrigena turkmenica]ADB60345.1 methyltransferase FkbM family [Haloterrigena turkmenica DSM 5511]
MAAIDSIERLFQTVYRGPVKRAAHATGINELLEWGLWAGYRTLNGGEKTLRIGGETTTFAVPTRSALGVLSVAGTVERPIYRDLLEHVRPDDVFWDVGANAGTYSCLVGSRLAGDGAVVSFEPYPPTVDLLKRNLRRNDVDATVVPFALGNADETTELAVRYDDEPGSQEHTLAPDRRESADIVDTVTVPVRRGDTLVDDGTLPEPTVLKIDAEGAGPAVLAGLESTLSNGAPRRVYVEPHENTDELEAILTEFGFSVTREYLGRHRSNRNPILVAARAATGPSGHVSRLLGRDDDGARPS